MTKCRHCDGLVEFESGDECASCLHMHGEWVEHARDEKQ